MSGLRATVNETGLSGPSLLVAGAALVAVGFGITLFFTWLGLNVIAGFDLSFGELVGIIVAGGAIAGRGAS